MAAFFSRANKYKSLLLFLFILLSSAYVVSSCGSGNGAAPAGNGGAAAGGTDPAVYTVIYNGNGSTGGSAPADQNKYQQGRTVTVSGNTGNLARPGYSFSGWNTSTDGSGTAYAAGQTFTMGTEDITLYAVWTSNPTYTITYDGNGNMGGSVPVDQNQYQQGQTVTVLGPGNLSNGSETFAGWNTQSDGNGAPFQPGQKFQMGLSNITLYAKWTGAPTYNVFYNGNNNTGGSPPADTNKYRQGQSITVLGNTGNLARTGYTFTGWNTQANGSGTTYQPGSQFPMGASNTTLYSLWTSDATYTVTYNGNGNTGGTPQADQNKYQQGQAVTVLGLGNLTNTGYVFDGWKDGNGNAYWPGQTFAMGANNVTLYAQWASPASRYAYVANYSDNTISQYTILSGGMLAPLSPATVPSGPEPSAVAVDPLGRFAYVTNVGDNTISQYNIGADGTLKPMAPATVSTGIWPSAITVDPSGSYVYVTNDRDNCSSSSSNTCGTVYGFKIGSGGALTQVSSIDAIQHPESVAVTPSGAYAYAGNESDSTVSQYTVGANGTLSSISSAWVFIYNASDAGSGPESIAIDPSGTYLYTADRGSNTITQFTIGANGNLKLTASFHTGSSPWSITLAPSGKYAYVANTGDNTISQYTIGTEGALVPMSPATVPAGASPRSVTVDPSGAYVYVANGGDGTISQYTIGAGGALTPISPATVPAGTRPQAIVTAR
ncbi:MAG: InlB B-repeat-containing protein [Actinomycetota bacterium]|nr:InlB B-repeat-containing protein [Actinomycetota bacterium]